MKRFLKGWALCLLLSPLSLLAQTHTVPTLDRDNLWTGHDTFTQPPTVPTPIQNTDAANKLYVDTHGGGGGGAQPCGTLGQIQIANTGGTALNCDPTFFYDPSAHTLHSGANTLVNALDSVPRKVFDPMNTERLGGLAAAIAGTSGHTPTEVIQATLDYAECQSYPNSYSRVILPVGLNIPISQILVWTHQELSGESTVDKPFLQHTDNTKAMVGIHGAADTITCPGLGTVTPGYPGGIVLKNFGINGMAAGGAAHDIGIETSAPTGEQCIGCRVSFISGGGNSFGGQGVLLLGTSTFGDHIGYEDAQIQGCYVYTHGMEPLSHSPTPNCGAVEDDVLDGELDYSYSSDGGQFLVGKGPGACYPGCAGFVFGGLNGHVNHVFSQISDVGAILSGTNVRYNDFRIDATSMEGIIVAGGGHILNGFTILAPCTSTSLQSNFNAGIATGCMGANIEAGGNYITNVSVSTNGGIFGQSFMQAYFDDGVGAANPPNYYNLTTTAVNANNQTPNLWPLFFANTGGQVPPIVSTPPGLSAKLTNTSGTANISGLSMLQINNSTPLTHVSGGIPGQILTIYAAFGGPGTATINHNPSSTGGGIITCSKQPTTVSVTNGAIFQYSLNNLTELGCDTQLDHDYINWAGNPTPTNPSFVTIYGNEVLLKSPAQPAVDFTNLHGAATGGTACFEEESLFPDNSHVVSALSCTTINLATMTPGAIFANPQPQAAVNLYLVSNTQGNGVPLGKYPAPAFVPGVPFFWDAVSVVATGGDGSTPPPAGENTTGQYWAPQGVKINTTAAQPTCTAAFQGVIWTVRNATTGDTLQQCQQVSGGSFAWQSFQSGGTVTGSGTASKLPMWSAGTAQTDSLVSQTGSDVHVAGTFSTDDATGNGGSWNPSEGTQPSTAAVGVDSCYASSSAHAILCSFNNGTFKQIPLYGVGTNSPPLQWYSFNSTTFGGTSTFGVGSLLQTAPSSTATITREDLVLATAPVGCTTQAVVTLYDETVPTTPVEVSSTLRITFVNGTRFYSVTPGSPFALTTGHQYMWGILTAAAGCTTSPAGPSWTVTYTVQ